MKETDKPAGTFKVFSSFSRLIERVEVVILISGVIALGVMLIANVIARTFFKSIYFVEELSEFLVLLITFVGVSYAVRKARHIRMGAFLDAFPVKLQKILLIFMSVINALVMFVMAYLSYNYMMDAQIMAHSTAALRLPYWYFYIVIPLGFFSSGVHYIRTIIKNIIEKDVWASPEVKNEYEAEEIVLGEVILDSTKANSTS